MIEEFKMLRRLENVLRARMHFLFEEAPMDPIFEGVGAAFDQVRKRLDEVAAIIAPVKSQ
jgi:hypothetical protein